VVVVLGPHVVVVGNCHARVVEWDGWERVKTPLTSAVTVAIGAYTSDFVPVLVQYEDTNPSYVAHPGVEIFVHGEARPRAATVFVKAEATHVPEELPVPGVVVHVLAGEDPVARPLAHGQAGEHRRKDRRMQRPVRGNLVEVPAMAPQVPPP